jgi:hypothetical protein
MKTGESIDVKPQALVVIDDALLRFRGRTLLSSAEVVDVLLDLRIAVDFETRLDALRDPVPSS